MAEITYSFFQWQKNDPDYTENTLIYLQPCKFNQVNFPNKFRQRQNNLKICKGKALSSLSSVTGLTWINFCNNKRIPYKRNIQALPYTSEHLFLHLDSSGSLWILLNCWYHRSPTAALLTTWAPPPRSSQTLTLINWMDSDSQLVPMKCLPQYQEFAKLFSRACAIFKTFFLNCGHQSLTVTMAVRNLSPPTQVSSYFHSQDTPYPIIIKGPTLLCCTWLLEENPVF